MQALDRPSAGGDERLAEIQGRLGVRLPTDYLDVVRTRQGAAPDRSVVTLSDGSGTMFGMLLHFEDGHYGNVFDILDWSELPNGMIPFAVDAGGNYLCFDYRSTATDPPLVLMSHEDSDAAPEIVAANFAQMINSLR